MKLNEYMMIKEAAAYLGVTGNTLKNWEKAGKIKTIRHPINNYRLYRKQDLDRLLMDIIATRSTIVLPKMPKEAEKQFNQRVQAIEEISGIDMDLLGPINNDK